MNVEHAEPILYAKINEILFDPVLHLYVLQTSRLRSSGHECILKVNLRPYVREFKVALKELSETNSVRLVSERDYRCSIFLNSEYARRKV